MEDYTNDSTDNLEFQLVAAERFIAQLRSKQAELLVEIDRRQVPLGDGCRSLREWVAGRLDVNQRNAAALTNISRRLADQPFLAKSLSVGEVSFDRAEALSRFEGEPDEFSHLGISALHQVASTNQITAKSAYDSFDSRELYLQPSLDQSRWKLWGNLPGTDGAIVQEALLAKAETFPTEVQSTSRAARNVDALTAICLDSLTGSSTEGSSPSIGLTVFVDTRYGGNGYLAGGPAVGPNTLEELLCTTPMEVAGVSYDGTPLGVGRKTSKIPPRLRRFVVGRDRCCTVAGCTSRYRLQAHHRQHWSDGGETEAENLISLCWYHHHVVVHQRGFEIDPDSPSGQIRFVRQMARAP